MSDWFTEKLKAIDEFDVDVYCEVYPDVIFEIILEDVPNKEQIEIAVYALEQFVIRYNKRHFIKPIHYISDIDNLPEGEHPRGIYVHIDFGGASFTALLGAVETIAKTKLPVFRVALL